MPMRSTMPDPIAVMMQVRDAHSGLPSRPMHSPADNTKPTAAPKGASSYGKAAKPKGKRGGLRKKKHKTTHNTKRSMRMFSAY